jgi:NDP-sugar pyrophosphorylase family protein
MKSIGNFLLEYDLFPNLTDQDCYGYITEAKFIDIGIPKDYGKTQHLF